MWLAYGYSHSKWQRWDLKPVVTEAPDVLSMGTQEVGVHACLLSLSDSCDSRHCSPPGSSVHGILQARLLEWAAIPFSRGIFSAQRWNPGLLQILYLLSPQGSPRGTCRQISYYFPILHQGERLRAPAPFLQRHAVSFLAELGWPVLYARLSPQSCPTLCDPMGCSPPGSSVRTPENTGVGCHVLLQGIFPTQGSNPGLPHDRQILYHLNHRGGPRALEWIAYPFSTGSSRPRNWTRSPVL